MEKRLGVTIKQSYVNRITTMFNSGMIPPENSDIVHRFYSGNQGQVQRFGGGRTKAGMVTASSTVK